MSKNYENDYITVFLIFAIITVIVYGHSIDTKNLQNQLIEANANIAYGRNAIFYDSISGPYYTDNTDKPAYILTIDYKFESYNEAIAYLAKLTGVQDGYEPEHY